MVPSIHALSPMPIFLCSHATYNKPTHAKNTIDILYDMRSHAMECVCESGDAYNDMFITIDILECRTHNLPILWLGHIDSTGNYQPW